MNTDLHKGDSREGRNAVIPAGHNYNSPPFLLKLSRNSRAIAKTTEMNVFWRHGANETQQVKVFISTAFRAPVDRPLSSFGYLWLRRSKSGYIRRWGVDSEGRHRSVVARLPAATRRRHGPATYVYVCLHLSTPVDTSCSH
jgi:hypothetical protein